MKNRSVILKDFKQWLSLKYSEKTISSYCYYVNKFLEITKNVPLRVTNKDFLDYNISLVHKGVSDSTRNTAISGVKVFFKFLKKKLEENVTIRPKKTKEVKRQIEHHFLISKICNTKNLKAKLIISLGYCGLRSNEVINLKITDIDTLQKTMIINGKGKKQRKLPISNNVLKLILNYLENYKPKIYLFNGGLSKKYFKPQYSPNSILKLVKQNIGNYKFHDLRHSFAMHLYRNGVSIESISKLLGHSKTETTEIYAYSTETMLLNIEMPY